MQKSLSIWTTAILVSTVSLIAHSTPLRGSVKSENGTPIAHVQIVTNITTTMGPGLSVSGSSSKEVITETDTQGRFSLPNHGRVIWFKQKDINPITKVVDLSLSELDIVAKDAASRTRDIPQCSGVKRAASRVGSPFKVESHDGVIARTRPSPDGNRDDYLFGIEVAEGKYEIMVIWGGSTSLDPGEDVLVDSKDISEHQWRSGNVVGLEIRGVRSNGKIWRRISFAGGALTYQGNSERSARVFDKMMDNVCLEESQNSR